MAGSAVGETEIYCLSQFILQYLL